MIKTRNSNGGALGWLEFSNSQTDYPYCAFGFPSSMVPTMMLWDRNGPSDDISSNVPSVGLNNWVTCEVTFDNILKTAMGTLAGTNVSLTGIRSDVSHLGLINVSSAVQIRNLKIKSD